MQRAITERQKQLLEVIYDFCASSGYPPTFEEMRQNLGVSSNQSIVDLLEKLRRDGFIKKDSGARSLAILHLGYEVIGRPALAPVLGTTTAGLPAESIEIAGDWHPVSSDVAKFAEDIFMLKISGDSMINAGIDDGDAVLVQTMKEFVSGDIVFAEIGDEGTVKRFMSDDKPPYVYLKPENPNYKNILFTDDVRLKGKIISVLKDKSWQSVK
ncbi:MAG: repressor LexA [Candidatus Colwellbacteria bacterium RIFCSPLOWO2_02_FULL_44_20b]|uniref:Repressor LexA n=1 Tax=Candidatus Colwellbacteria bacterium RIFCSPLOWO2_02_FULL_44_20b TaxID=1797691 RepID=A0A1G1Z8E5_9BACT|nr:MAG: repressor LexA [Candidatus Colwellbacteria bacterium RIFCSPLOWO2_02_FULL_44_20b]